MADMEARWLLPCRRFVPLTHLVFTVTSLVISNLIGLSAAQTQVLPYGWVHSVNGTNQTKECHPCPEVDDSDSDTSVGVILGSAIAGAIVGSLVTYAVMTCLRNRSLSPPPKDYDGREDQAQFDVNQNDDVTLTNGGDKDLEEGSDPNATKSHKKLERLVQRNNYQKPVDLNAEIEMAAVPLIHNTDSSSDVTTPPRRTHSGSNENGDVTPDRPSRKPSSPPSRGTGTNEQQQRQQRDEEPGYLNVGGRSPLEQPYDTLAIVPEEVEYENQTQNVYEPILQDTDNSSKA